MLGFFLLQHNCIQSSQPGAHLLEYASDGATGDCNLPEDMNCSSQRTGACKKKAVKREKECENLQERLKRHFKHPQADRAQSFTCKIHRNISTKAQTVHCEYCAAKGCVCYVRRVAQNL